MVDPDVLERIAARRAEMDELDEQLAEQLDRLRAERDELAVAERVLVRMAEQLAVETAAAVPPTAQVAGRAVLMVPHRGRGGPCLPPRCVAAQAGGGPHPTGS